MPDKKAKFPSVDIAFKSGGRKLADSEFLRELAKAAERGDKLREALLFAMKDFEPYNGDFLMNQEARLSMPNFPPADMVFLTFVNLCGHTYAGRFEKVAWSIAFTYKSVPFAFSLQKFGLRLYHGKDASPTQELCEEMIRALSKAMVIIAKLMEPVVAAQVSAGNVTIANSFPQLNNMYGYFRKQAKEHFEVKPPNSDGPQNLGALLSAAMLRDSAAGFNTVAMIDAYFSRLEHLLVILLAFCGYERDKHDLIRIVSGFWSDKYKTIFNLETDATAKNLYDRLSQLRERQRNPIAHGNFQKDGKSLYFHFGGVGAISCHLSNSEDRPKALFFADRFDFEKACALFDELDKYLAEGIAKYGFRYASSGLNIAFDEKNIAKYRAAASDEDTFSEFLKGESYIADMHANMDW